MNNRIKWIDISKGIGIILVIVGHGIQEYNLTNLNGINKLIYLFHMPLFFVLSGCVSELKVNNNLSFKDTIVKKTKRLFIPYVIFCLVTMILHIIESLCLKKYIFWERLFSIDGMINTLLITQKSVFSNLWFLPCMISLSFIIEFYERYIKKAKTKYTIAAILAIIMLIFGDKISFPMYINTSFVAIIFFYIGKYYMKKKIGYAQKVFFILSLIGFSFCSIIYFIKFNECVCSFYNLKIEIPKIMFFIGAITGVFSIMYISEKIGSNIFLEYIGKESLYFYGIHFFMQNVISILIKIMKIDTNNDLIIIFFTTLLNIVLSTACIEFFKRLKRRRNEKKHKSKLYI